MPTLAEKGKFNFHPSAQPNATSTMKSWIENLKAIEIIINVLNIKLSQPGKSNRLYFLRGRTGSGKSTYMIQELYKHLIDNVDYRTTLFCTQPRVVLTKSNPTELIRYNKDWAFGKNIGVRNGSEKIATTTDHTIIYCTTQIMGNLLVELCQETDKEKQNHLMRAMRIIVVDECHVLDQPMMALLKNVYDVISKFGDDPNCPLFIFSSATIDLENMVKYYFRDDSDKQLSNPLMIGDVQGVPNFPVEEEFVKSSELRKLNKQEQAGTSGFELLAEYFISHYLERLFMSKSTIKIGDEVVRCRDALLFVPLFSAITLIGEYIQKHVSKKHLIFVVKKDCQMSEVVKWRNNNRNKTRLLFIGYGRNYAQASDELLSTAFEQDPEARKNEIKIICSTSVIETGKTISTLYLCLNMGIETMSIYNPLSYNPCNPLQYLKQVPNNKNQTIQRKGRVGRECPGLFVHFYSQTCYDKFRTIDVAETINNSYLSALVLNDLSQHEVGSYHDVFNLNNYYYPTSTDILINSSRDLVNAGYLTPFGQFVELINSLKHCENWVIYAKFLFYCQGWSLWEALLLASLNRKAMPPMMTLFTLNPRSLRYQLKDINENNANDDIIESIMRARNTMTSIIYGNDITFKCPKDRIYERLQIDNGSVIHGKGVMSDDDEASDDITNEVAVKPNDEATIKPNDDITNEATIKPNDGITNDMNKPNDETNETAIKPNNRFRCFNSWHTINDLGRI